MKQILRALPSALFVGFAGVVLLANASCDPIKRLRHTIHGEEPEAAEGAPGEGAAAGAGISVTVQPPSGVSILIDGIKVATQSPYDGNNLEPGTHTLLVRGMGYQTITLPVELKKQDTLKVPIALLPRPQIRPAPPLPADEEDAPPRAERPPERPRSRPQPPAPALDLPQGVASLDVHFIAQPANPVLLDGQRLDGKTLRIHKQNGVLQVGNLTLLYLVTDSRVLDLTVPNDDGTYNRDGIPLPAGSVIHLTHGATRIHRTGDNEQAVILKRNN